MTSRRKLPIGIQTFADIVSGEYYYADKTPHIERLINAGKYFFLSRPRRFGKSLLLYTLKSLFEGREALFRGLYIHDRWEWSVHHPVIRLSFADGVLQSRQQTRPAHQRNPSRSGRETQHRQPLRRLGPRCNREGRQQHRPSRYGDRLRRPSLPL
ncbi:AAA family ATPase [Halorhodospira halochloris]|uniref:AAA family ATPase n=1 Tax=Halorhodospira halochloris TaxID=1052 RepID=UPI0030840C90